VFQICKSIISKPIDSQLAVSIINYKTL